MKSIITLSIFLASLLTVSAQKKIGGVSIPESLTVGSTELILNGGGIREKLWLDMYVGGLYLKAKSSDAQKIIAADEPMAIKLHIVSGLITSEKMEDATREGFTKSTKDNTSALMDRINTFMDVFREGIEVNDIFNLVYVPGKGVNIYKNKTLKTNIKGLDFKQALFGIWLCNEPPDEDLREGMLGLD